MSEPKTQIDGASINHVRDPRVSAAAQWFGNIIQGLVVIVLCFVARNLWQVNLTLAADAENKKAIMAAITENRAHIERHDGEIGQIQRDIAIMGGPNFRGPPPDRRRGY